VVGKGAPLRPLVSAVLARSVCAVILLFFCVVEIAVAKMLLFFRESAAMDILNIFFLKSLDMYAMALLFEMYS
jgi:hypothetical protein